jgi:ribosomal protein S27AE
MNRETINVEQEMARLRVYDALRKAHGHGVAQMLESIPQDRAARLASVADDAVVALRDGCPDCGAMPGEACHVDCMSRWDDGGLS